jgi:alcohol dehydrogenase class IV
MSPPPSCVDGKKLKQLAPKTAEDAIASVSPGNNPRLATKDEIIELSDLAFNQ